MAKSTHATRTKIFEAGKLMETVIDRLPDGFCRYRDDHSDATVATTLGISVNSARGIRQELFGKLKAPTTAPGSDERVAALEAALADLTDRYNKLVALLSLNRVADCRHLAVSDRVGR